ncbi:MAG: radical SAM protein [Oscillospiraceae bacterium]|nr:radical SAM protein [Oscillospiraceae bacterium]
MIAKIKPGYDSHRQKLADIVPLDAPFTVFIASTQICNFKCSYCTQSLSQEEKEAMQFRAIHMEDALFKKIVNDACEFEGKIKRVVFTGLGEPLANPRIPRMIKELNEKKIAQGYEIITNAYLLSHNMTDDLLDAGLTYLRVSIQGLTAKRYREVTGVEIDFDRLMDNLCYFYERRGNCKLYIKIMDECLTDGETQEDFFHMFGDICDHIYVEHLVNAQPSMEGKYSEKMNPEMTFYGEPSQKREVCPFMFYSLQIDAEGNTFPCPPLGHSKDFSLGNLMDASMKDIWNSEKLDTLYRMHLTGQREKVAECINCGCYKTFTPSEDNLDPYRDEIVKRLEARRNG